MQSRIGHKIKELRKGMRLTQKELGERIGVPQATVSKWEAGAQMPDQENLLRVSKFFGIDAEEMIGITTQRPTGSTGRLIALAGKVAAGNWVESFDIPEGDEQYLSVPIDPALDAVPLTAFDVEGTSCDKIFPDGSKVFVAPLAAVPGAPKSGDMVLAIREDHGAFERTLKEYVVDSDGRKWLWPRSSDPAHQAPIEFKKGGRSPETVRIAGVVMSYMITMKRR
jgi:transcriptional regulator with XRE-family HTH domain